MPQGRGAAPGARSAGAVVPGSAHPARAEKFRPEVQALRAVAVAIVVLYHFWPGRVPGGFVGVDVFFVISGFLIVSHLRSEFDRTGRVDLLRFWARRARRLLPASLLVLAVVAVGTMTILPGSEWVQALKEIVASALYVENWALAIDSVDYLAAANVASPVQHFWSLSVEEQFYLVVPILLVLAALTRRRHAMWIMLVVVVVSSLAYSVWLTATAPGPAYFATTTRAWEFAAGGLLAFLPPVVGFARGRAVIGWVGWVVIVVVALTYNGDLPFPSYTAALPVVATLAVIFAGQSALAWSPERFIATRPATFLGDISYSVYLWHWPVLVFAATSSVAVKLVLIPVVLVLSWLTWRFVENPARRLSLPRPRFTFVFVAAAMAVVAVPAGIGAYALTERMAAEAAEAQAEALLQRECFGATADRSCTFDELVPQPASAPSDTADAYSDGCIATLADPTLITCHYGVDDAAATARVALIGDSHAVSWLPAIQVLAERRGWSVTSFFKSSCPHSTAEKLNDDDTIGQSCADWNTELAREIADQAPYDLVFVTHSVRSEDYESPQIAAEGFREAWRMFTSRGAQVVVLRDTHYVRESTLACLERNQSSPSACDIPEEEAMYSPDLMVVAAEGEDSTTVIDLTDRMCWDGTCRPVVGGVITHRDTHHLTRTFAITLTPLLERELVRVGLVT